MGMLAILLAALATQERPLTTAPGAVDTAKFSVTGRLILDYVNRSEEITAFTRSEANPTGNGAAGLSDAENTFEGDLRVRFDVQLSSSVSAVVEVGVDRFDEDEAFRFGRESAQDVVLLEAKIVFGEVLTPALRAEIGISGWSYDLRGRGSPLVFDPRHSQTITRDIDSLGNPGAAEQGDARLVESGFPNELQPVGVVFAYDRDAWHFDIVLLPAVIEGGPPSADEALYAIDVLYALDNRGSRLGFIVALSAFESNTAPPPVLDQETSMFTVGAGAVLKGLISGVELYGEVYLQRGNAGQIDFGGNIDTLKAEGHAFQLGLHWNHEVANPMPIWAGANVTSYSGDDDDLADQDTKVGRFAGYEGVNDLLIIENMYYGFDIDSNITVLKFNAGLRTTVRTENDLEIEVWLGLAQQTEATQFGTEEEDAIGNEVDLKLRWVFTKQFMLKLDVGLLFGADLLEESLRQTAPDQADDSAWLWVLGFDVKW
jgi:hypothetical protein